MILVVGAILLALIFYFVFREPDETAVDSVEGVARSATETGAHRTLQTFIYPIAADEPLIWGTGTAEASVGTQMLADSLSSGVNMLSAAEQLLRSSVSLYEEKANRLPGLTSERLAEVLNNLGVVYLAMGKGHQAMELFERAVTHFQAANTRDGDRLGGVRKNLSIIYEVMASEGSDLRK